MRASNRVLYGYIVTCDLCFSCCRPGATGQMNYSGDGWMNLEAEHVGCLLCCCASCSSHLFIMNCLNYESLLWAKSRVLSVMYYCSC
jgi:hypothetical protein